MYTMGGLAGHMMHPHDNLNMRICSFKKLIISSVTGRLGMKEKVDGFNIHIAKVNGEMRFARNSSDLVEGGFKYEDIWKRFDNERVREVFSAGWNRAKQVLNLCVLEEFSTGHCTINAEIVVAGQTNVMVYQDDLIVIHNLQHWNWDEKHGKYIKGEITGVPTMIGGDPIFISTNNLSNRVHDLDYIMEDIENEFDKYDMQDDETLLDYYKCKFVEVMTERIPSILNNPQLSVWAFNRIFSLNNELNLRQARTLAGEEYKEELTTVLNHKTEIFATCRAELDYEILRIGNYILNHVEGINNTIFSKMCCHSTILEQIMRAVNDEDLTTSARATFKRRWGATALTVPVIEGVVVNFEGQQYKWTGAFAPINQLLGGMNK